MHFICIFHLSKYFCRPDESKHISMSFNVHLKKKIKFYLLKQSYTQTQDSLTEVFNFFLLYMINSWK